MTLRTRLMVVIWLLLLTGLFAVPVAGALYVARVPDFFCSERVAPPASEGDGEWTIRARTTLLPLGTECTFVRPSGEEIVVGPGPLLTVFSGAAVLFAGLSVGAMLWPPPRGGAPTSS